MSILTLLVLLIVAFLILSLVQLLPLGEPYKRVIYIVTIIVMILWLLESIGVLNSGHLRVR